MRANRALRIVACAVVLGFFGASARAGTLSPAADGSVFYVEHHGSLTTYADAAQLWHNVFGDENRGVVEFDISPITEDVVSATLVVNVMTRTTLFPGGVTVCAYPGNGALNVGDYYATFTWHGMVGQMPVGTLAFPDGPYEPTMPYRYLPGVFAEVDVTAALQFAHDEGWDYVGFMFHVPAVGNGDATFATTGSAYPGSVPPTLRYELIPEPATLALLALGGLAALRRRQA